MSDDDATSGTAWNLDHHTNGWLVLSYNVGFCGAETGLPPGVVNIITGGPEVGDHLVRSLPVDKIAFTGGGNVGRQIVIGAAANFTRVTLELGGKSAAIVLDDAPTDDILRTLAPAGVANAGQVCRALTRVRRLQALGLRT